MSDPKASPTGAQLLAQIRPVLRERSVNICLRPDILDDWQDADEALHEAEAADEEKSSTRKLGAGAPAATRKLAERVRELETQMDEAQIKFTFRAMAKDRWQRLCELHPPRADNAIDAYVGYDRQTVSDDAVRECLIDPVFTDCVDAACDHSSCGSWQQLLAVCNPSEWGALRNTVDSLNGVVEQAPKSEAASRILDRTAAASRQRKRGE